MVGKVDRLKSVRCQTELQGNIQQGQEQPSHRHVDRNVAFPEGKDTTTPSAQLASLAAQF